MQSRTYTDIIDEKIALWQNGLKKLEARAGNAIADTPALLNAKSDALKSAIDNAIVELRDLDAQERVDNTMATKDKILQIFSSIDKAFMDNEEKSPFML